MRALAEIVEQQRRHDEREPGQSNRPLAEVSHVRVERLGARHREHDRAEREKSDAAVVGEELQAVQRIQRGENARFFRDFPQAQAADRHEPDAHDRAERRADSSRAKALYSEQHEQDHHGHRHDHALERRRDDVQAFDRAKHGDHRCDHAVAVEQRRAEEPESDEDDAPPRPRPALLLQEQREQRENAALAAVVGAHDEHEVLHGDDEHEQPHDQRQHAVHVGRGRRNRVLLRRETLLQRVERARPDVAVDDAERGQREEAEPFAPRVCFDGVTLRNRCRVKSSRRAGRLRRAAWKRQRRRLGGPRAGWGRTGDRARGRRIARVTASRSRVRGHERCFSNSRVAPLSHGRRPVGDYAKMGRGTVSATQSCNLALA